MKFLKIYILALSVMLSSLVKAQFVSAELQVSGLTCSMCSKATDKSLRTLDFIQDIRVDLDHATYTLIFKPDKKISMDQIAQKVEAAGFSVNKLIAWFNFNELKVSNDYHFMYQSDAYHFINPGDKVLKGKTALTFIDKSFIPQKQFKQHAGEIKYECYKSGFMEKCCPMNKKERTRIYHVTI